QGAEQVRSPLQKRKQEQPEPKCSSRKKSPFVQREFAQPGLPGGRRERGALNLIAREAEISAKVGIARNNSFGLTISGNSASDLARFEKCVAKIKAGSGRGDAGLEEVLESSGGFGVFALII